MLQQILNIKMRNVMNKAIVSVVIPVYNGQQYMKSCLEQVLHQTYDALEVIVVDDGSTDASGRIAEEMAKSDHRIQVLHQENAGVSAARNRALDVMTGQYAVFVDVDDEVEKDYIECLVKQLEEQHVQLAICGYRIAERGTASAGKCCSFQDEVIPVELALERILRFQKYNPSIWNKMFLTSVIRAQKLRFETDIAIGEDMLFLIRYCMQVQSCSVIGKALYIYYTNPAGAMQERKNSGEFKEKWLSEWKAVLLAEQELHEHGFSIKAMSIKKVRAADKLLSTMAAYHYPDNRIRQELLLYLRKNLLRAMAERDYNAQKKLSILFNCISPAFANWIRCMKKR
jgi:glycosyltransferase involved in cell wall biosynthesis